MKWWFQRDKLEKILAQEHGHTWEASRKAVTRYMIEAYGGSPRWFELVSGNLYAIAEWIDGTDRYWVPRGKRWSVKFPEDWPEEWLLR